MAKEMETKAVVNTYFEADEPLLVVPSNSSILALPRLIFSAISSWVWNSAGSQAERTLRGGGHC